MADSRPLLLEVEHLCKWFPLKRTAGDVLQRKEKRYLKAVNDVSFQLFKGENLGLVGESGCGKSTLARTILRLYEPTSGTIRLNGTDISHMKGDALRRLRPQMQMIFQDPYSPIKTTIFVHKENSYYTMNHTVEDLSLFNALRQGDGNSFDHLFRRYYPMLCAYAHRLVSLEDAEEIVQEVMLWLWENRGDLIIESSLNQYLFKMTYRRVLNHLTREQVKTKAEAAFYERTQAALCEVDYGRFEELDRKIKEAMAALPDSYREAFVMHRFKELSYKEIAEVLDVSPQTVAYRIQQALKLLRVSLKDYLPMLVWLVG